MARSLCYCVRKFCAYISNSPLSSTDLELTMFDSYIRIEHGQMYIQVYIVSYLAGFSSYIAQTVCVCVCVCVRVCVCVCVRARARASVISRPSRVSSTSAHTS